MLNAHWSHLATWSIAAGTLAGIITRPRKWSEAWWAVSGAAALVLLSLMPPASALAAAGKGTDVYLFLTGMMLVAEIARREGLFEWLAARALQQARGSGRRLFLLIYAVGTLVTVFLSNDATAVVLTPAVYAVARRAGAPATPYLLICAFIANAASFVLPISNPANLVVFGDHLPPLRAWLAQFAAPSAASIVCTYLLLRRTQRGQIPAQIATAAEIPTLSYGGRLAAAAIAMTGIALLVASVMGWQLGLPTCVAGLMALLTLAVLERRSPWPVLRQVSWSVLPLVAGLFVLVQAIEGTGEFALLSREAAVHAQQSPLMAAFVGGGVVALGSNLINNLPMGLISATLTQSGHLPDPVSGALLIGVDLGPNLSITGSLATILWLTAIRREGEDVSAGRFLAIGSLVMPLTLLPTLGLFCWTSLSGTSP